MKSIDNNGRIVIPKEIRKVFEHTDDLVFKADEDCITIRPKYLNTSITSEDMDLLRRMYLILIESNTLAEPYSSMLKRITKVTDVNCTTCGSPLFICGFNSYKCYKCE